MRVNRPALTLCGWLLVTVLTGCASTSASPAALGVRPESRPTPLGPVLSGATELDPEGWDAVSGEGSSEEWEVLFPAEGVPAGWLVRSWHDVSRAAPPAARWVVTNGVLRGSRPGGTWLVSPREYEDFLLEFEYRLGERGNSGVGLRFPSSGDPAFTGVELQLVDPAYYGTGSVPSPEELTGALYKLVGPAVQAQRPGEWNRCAIECRGRRIRVSLNGAEVINVDLAGVTEPAWRGRPAAERPLRGRIGFQEISRGGSSVEIRGARIRVLS